MTQTKEEALAEAKLGLLVNGSKFISTIAFNLKHAWDESINPPTAEVDGITITYHPKFFMDLTKKERTFLIAHEAWHVALMHLTRRETRKPELYNIAGDYVINLLLHNAGMQMPKGGYLDTSYHGLSTNDVYEKLVKNPPPKNKENNIGNDLKEGSTPEEKAEIDGEVKKVLIKAVTQAKLNNELNKNSGIIPSEVLRNIDILLNPVLPWQTLIQRFLTDMAKDDYTWTKPNKYFMPEHILPTQYSESLGHLVYAIDTSGSLNKKELTEILSEIQYIHQTYKPKQMTLLACDYVLHEIHNVVPEDDITQLKFSGGGGTSFKPVFDYLSENPPQALIYFTDLYAEDIKKEVPYPVIWVCNSKHEPAKIGETIYLNRD